MPQIGSFTHTIKVQRLEAAMQVAVAAQRNTPDGKVRDAKTKAVRNLATKLLAARLQVLRSRAADMQPKGASDGGVRARMARMRADGIAAILSEFGALES